LWSEARGLWLEGCAWRICERRTGLLAVDERLLEARVLESGLLGLEAVETSRLVLAELSSVARRLWHEAVLLILIEAWVASISSLLRLHEGVLLLIHPLLGNV
jgi:hypothetical protein